MTNPIVFAVIGDSHYVRPESHEKGFSHNTFGDQHDLHRYIHFHQYVIPEIIGAVAELKPNFIVNTGDVVQGNCDDAKAALKEMDEALKRFDKAGAPVFYAVGNHDGIPHKEPVEQLLYAANRKALGKPADQGYYRFVKGNSLFIVLNYYSFQNNSDQATFIRESLKIGSDYEHVFVFAHPPLVPIIRPFFTNFDFAQTVLHVAAEYRIDAYFCGHTHNQIASLHQVADYWLPQLKSCVIGEPGNQPVPIEEVRPLLPSPESVELCWGYLEGTAPGWWMVTVDRGQVTVDWHVLGKGPVGQLSWEGREKPRMTRKPSLSSPAPKELPPVGMMKSVRLRVTGMLCKEDTFKASLNGQNAGCFPRMGAFGCRSFLEIDRSMWPAIGVRNRLVVTTAVEEMSIGGFVLEIETEKGWIRSVPTTFFTNTSRWDKWNTHGLQHIAPGEDIVEELVFKHDNIM